MIQLLSSAHMLLKELKFMMLMDSRFSTGLRSIGLKYDANTFQKGRAIEKSSVQSLWESSTVNISARVKTFYAPSRSKNKEQGIKFKACL